MNTRVAPVSAGHLCYRFICIHQWGVGTVRALALAFSRTVVFEMHAQAAAACFKKELAPREWARTTDLTVNSRPLYQLSYRGTIRLRQSSGATAFASWLAESTLRKKRSLERADGFEPPSSSG
jgi:hypothetical protein